MDYQGGMNLIQNVQHQSSLFGIIQWSLRVGGDFDFQMAYLEDQLCSTVKLDAGVWLKL